MKDSLLLHITTTDATLPRHVDQGEVLHGSSPLAIVRRRERGTSGRQRPLFPQGQGQTIRHPPLAVAQEGREDGGSSSRQEAVGPRRTTRRLSPKLQSLEEQHCLVEGEGEEEGLLDLLGE